jgi:predicted fused transcriptional regulator/phosphomethylpyrimidine kinase/predicted transcriptional regulator
MQPPDELMIQAFLPAMRQLVAIRLRSEGLSQNRISSLLGITQASVSNYLSSDPERAKSILAQFLVTGSDADRYSAVLAQDVKKDPVAAVRTLNEIWTGLLGKGAVCQSHRALYPSLADCDVCIREYGERGGTRSETISEVADAVRLLEASETFVSVMPEVSVNIACAAGEAQTPADVVAIPGRIVRVRGRAKAMLPPEAGASIHMARILLLVRKLRPDLRACINLLYDDKMARTLKKLGLKVLEVAGHLLPGVQDPTSEALERRLSKSPLRFDAVVDRGGSGIEPNTYLFARGAGEVAELALRVSRAYSAR